jgi:hypothetical protein
MTNYVDEEDRMWNVGWFKYECVPGYPRADHYGEQVYYDEWVKFCKSRGPHTPEYPNARLASLLHQMPCVLDQRQVTVCTTLATWMGTSCGQSILFEGDRLERGHCRYLMAWAKENKRFIGVNHGVRALEAILAKPEHCGKSTYFGLRIVKRPRLSTRDYETADNFMVWLESDAARDWRATCERRIKEHNEIKRRMRDAAFKKRRDSILGGT